MRWTALFLIAGVASAMPPVPRVMFPEPDATESPSDAAALAERIAKTSKSVSDKLAGGKTETATLKDQKQVKDDLDAIIKLLEPPPQSNSSSSSSSSGSPPPPMGGSTPPPPPPKGGESKSEPKLAAGSPAPEASQPAGAQPGSATAPPRALVPHEESLARDFWGHLPDAPRQQMMQFYREQYMGKYKDLLADYYKSLAEKEKK